MSTVDEDTRRGIEEIWNGRRVEGALLERDRALDDLVQFVKSKRRYRETEATEDKINRLVEAQRDFQVMMRRYYGSRPALKAVS